MPVHNSNLFGACGFYALMAVEAGLIGMVTTSAAGIQVSPTNGAQARLDTDPIAFAAPGKPGEPFLLDMATTTVAAGKIRNKANEKLPTPGRLAGHGRRQAQHRPLEVSKGGFMTPLGGTPEGSSHKGYGLAAMVNILSSALSGGFLVTDPARAGKTGMIGHFMMAIDPTSAPTSRRSAIRCAPPSPADPAKPVQVAGDPERRIAEQRRKTGIPVGAGLLDKVRDVARHSNAEWILDG